MPSGKITVKEDKTTDFLNHNSSGLTAFNRAIMYNVKCTSKKILDFRFSDLPVY